jgi:hypothetical protein
MTPVHVGNLNVLVSDTGVTLITMQCTGQSVLRTSARRTIKRRLKEVISQNHTKIGESPTGKQNTSR